jgi:hypothetical protein
MVRPCKVNISFEARSDMGMIGFGLRGVALMRRKKPLALKRNEADAAMLEAQGAS